MQELIRRLPPKAEFTIVVMLAFGYFILGSLIYAFAPNVHATAVSDRGLRWLLGYEGVMLLLLSAFLWVRGWRPGQLGLRPGLKDTVIGLGLAAVGYIAYLLVWLVASSLVPSLGYSLHGVAGGGLGLATVVAVSILNPFFEEIFVCGYVISALKTSRGVYFAVNVSVAIRLAYHLYQGALGVIGIVPLGLIFGHWFARTGRLWPVVVAHALFDFIALLAFVHY